MAAASLPSSVGFGRALGGLGSWALSAVESLWRMCLITDDSEALKPAPLAPTPAAEGGLWGCCKRARAAAAAPQGAVDAAGPSPSRPPAEPPLICARRILRHSGRQKEESKAGSWLGPARAGCPTSERTRRLEERALLSPGLRCRLGFKGGVGSFQRSQQGLEPDAEPAPTDRRAKASGLDTERSAGRACEGSPG